MHVRCLRGVWHSAYLLFFPQRFTVSYVTKFRLSSFHSFLVEVTILKDCLPHYSQIMFEQFYEPALSARIKFKTLILVSEVQWGLVQKNILLVC